MGREIDEEFVPSWEELEEQDRLGFRMEQANDVVFQQWANKYGIPYQSYMDHLAEVGLLSYYQKLFDKVGEEL